MHFKIINIWIWRQEATEKPPIRPQEAPKGLQDTSLHNQASICHTHINQRQSSWGRLTFKRKSHIGLIYSTLQTNSSTIFGGCCHEKVVLDTQKWAFMSKCPILGTKNWDFRCPKTKARHVNHCVMYTMPCTFLKKNIFFALHNA